MKKILSLFTIVKQGTVLIKILLQFLLTQSIDENKQVKNDIQYQIVLQFEQICNDFFNEVIPYQDFIDSLKNIKQLFFKSIKICKTIFSR